MICTLLLSLCLVAQDPASQPTTRAEPDLVVLHMNDFHGQILPKVVSGDPRRASSSIGGYAALSRFVASERERHGTENVWVTDAGDWFQGTPEGNEDKGASVIECFNRLGLVAQEIGNHEYDFGEDNVARIVALAKHPILGANIADAKRPGELRPYARPYVVLTHKGVRVAIVGLVTKTTKSVATGPFGDADFKDEIETLNAVLPEARGKADVCVLLTHCGVETDRKLAQAFPEIPLILGGHSHTQLRRPVHEGKTWIVQSGSSSFAMTRVSIRLAEKAPRFEVLESEFVELRHEQVGVDPEAAAFVKQRFAAIAAKLDTVVGTIEGDLGRGRDRGPSSTAAGNMLAQLIREVGGAQVGLTNKGGIRTSLALGPITRRQVYELVPFENTVVTFAMSGAVLKKILQQSLAESRRPLEIDGASYEYEIRDGARILKAVTLKDGVQVEDGGTYKVATNSFLAGGADELPAFLDAERLPQTERMKRFLRDLLIEALTERGSLRVTGEDRIHAR